MAAASEPHFATAVTVVRDDADSLVVRLETGTPVLRAARADGREKRADRETLFTTNVVSIRGRHGLYDQIRVALTGRPWSAWAFFLPDSAEFVGWYVNLERPHVRDAHSVYTSDHVLDLWVAPDRTVLRKDEEELEHAVAQGVFDDAEARLIWVHCEEVEALIAEWGPPFCDGWERFLPDIEWPVPDLV